MDKTEISSLVEKCSFISTLPNNQRKNSLLAHIQPLFIKLTELSSDLFPGKSFDEIMQIYAYQFITKAPVATALLDVDFKFLVTSPLWEEWFKTFCMKESIINRTLTGQSLIDTCAWLPLGIYESLQGALRGESYQLELLEVVTNQQQKRWIRWEAFPWMLNDKKLLGIGVFCEDVTDNHDLLRNNVRLQTSNEILQNFALVLSHDIIQPMRQVSNYTELLETSLSERLLENQGVNDSLRALKNCITHVQEMCQGIVLYSKDGNLTVNREVVSFSEVLCICNDICLRNTQVKLSSRIKRNLKIFINKACIIQLFQNLIDNAIKHSSGSDITIRLNAQPDKPGYYKFFVNNSSTCNSAVKNKNVFNIFESSNIDGAGVGLMICKKIITAYGGDIDFTSSSRKGTTVSFTLPVLLADEEQKVVLPHQSSN